MSNCFQRRFQMTTPLPTDLSNLKCQFESWRKTRTKRTRTPDHLLKAPADLLDQYPVSTICRVCRINPLTLRQWNITSKTTSKIQALPDADFFPLLVSQNHNRIDPRGSPGRNITRCQRHCREQYWNRRERKRI